MPQKFLQYDNRSKNNGIQIFISVVDIKYLSDSERWQSDGSFKSVSKPFKQLYVLLAGKSSEKVLPCAYILMQKKNFAAYKEMFDQLKLIAEDYGCNLAAKFGLTDIEHTVRKALNHCFPQIKLRVYYFHFKQAVGRWIFQHGFKSHYEKKKKFVNGLKIECYSRSSD